MRLNRKDLEKELEAIASVIKTAEEINDNASDRNQDPKKHGITWHEYRSLTQSIKKTLEKLVGILPDGSSHT